MATDPDKTHVFTSDFKQLQYITNDLKKAICLSKCSACRDSVTDLTFLKLLACAVTSELCRGKQSKFQGL